MEFAPEKKVKICPNCNFKCKYNRQQIEEYFGYRSCTDKGSPLPQSYCRECRNVTPSSKPKKGRMVGKVDQVVNVKRKEVKEKMPTVGEVVLRKEIEKQSEERKKEIKRLYKEKFPHDTGRRGYDYMEKRLAKNAG